MKSKKIYYSFFLIYVIILIVVDQLTKHIVRLNLSGGDLDIIPGVLQLHLLFNTGAAFSILTGKTIFFYILTPIVACIIIIFFLKLPLEKKYQPMALCLSTLMAGALGNYIDRLVFGKVTDFIYFSLINFPVFNVADIYVTLSVIFMLILILFKYRDEDISRWLKKKKA
ncbi:MAG: signal peptidase II [Candidatus Weimeria sp.]